MSEEQANGQADMPPVPREPAGAPARRSAFGLPATPGEQLFLLAVAGFLLAYLVGLVRTRSLEWATLIGTLALGIIVIAGLLVLRVIAPTLASDHADQESPTGTAVDLRLPPDDEEEEEEYADAS